MKIHGKVIANLGVQTGTSKAGNEWSKATLIIETFGQYPKKVVLDNMRNADKFAAIAVGTEGTFQIEVESREFNGKWFTAVNCWGWTIPYEQNATQPPHESQSQTNNYQQAQVQTPPPPATQPVKEGDLPF